MSILSSLNEEQRRAAAWPGGPMLVLAGAGSGKTRVITHRVAWLLGEGVPPERLVAMTFTNKAAGEMKERVLRLLGVDPAHADAATRAPWMGTFHAYCLRLLRREAPRAGLSPGFTVYDQDDSRALVKASLRAVGLDDREIRPARVAARISRLKADCVGPGAAPPSLDPVGDAVRRVYPEYQRRLQEANACDFDDLLMRAVLLLERDEDVRGRVQERILHLLVDEYQDTNRIQYRLIRLLSGRHGNACAVGDEDQSIYRFRGADIGNILRFEEDFPGATVFHVEQNYRSTGHVLGAAGGVVDHNVRRKGKRLWTDLGDGDPVQVHGLATSEDEAEWIAREIGRTGAQSPLSEIAVLYRTNAQSRPFEQALGRRGVAHAVIGATRFFERREVRDVLAYLRLVANPADDVAFERVLNVPARGIGEVTRAALRAFARDRGLPLGPALLAGLEAGALPPRAEAALDAFASLVESLREQAPGGRAHLGDLVALVVRETGYEAELGKEGPEIAAERMANVEELRSAAALHQQRVPGADLASFLAEVALSSDTDELGQPDRVTLMTLHSAKGLEFDTVFLAGVEEDLLPHAASADEEALEEERRLCYVGMTRARRRLVLTHCALRWLAGRAEARRPSRFLAEIPERHVRRTGQGRAPAPARPTRARAPGGPGSLDAGALSAVQGFFGEAVEPEDVSQEQVWEEPEYEWSGPAAAVPAAAPAPLRRGDLVRHARFGVGKILGLETVAGKTKLTVYFGAHGRVKLMAEHARLDRIE